MNITTEPNTFEDTKARAYRTIKREKAIQNAEIAFEAHCDARRQDYEYCRENFVSLLIDLMHFADKHGLSYAEAEYIACKNYKVEVER